MLVLTMKFLDRTILKGIFWRTAYQTMSPGTGLGTEETNR
jgi:hypothetical protein